jgi:hypothetical protein
MPQPAHRLSSSRQAISQHLAVLDQDKALRASTHPCRLLLNGP